MDEETYKTLTQIDFFRDFSRTEVSQVMRVANWVRVASGTMIITEGADDLFMYVLLRGQVNVVKNGKVLASLGPGELFGEISALAHARRSAHVVAHGEVICLRFEPQLLERLPADLQLRIVKKVLFALADRLTVLNRKFCVT